jgi:ribosome assembly protein YihI (activator of Der GTPase)
MTTSETSKTSEKKYQTSGCACGPKNCETKRPSAQARDPKSSKPHELKRAKNCATYSGTRTRCVRRARRARRSTRRAGARATPMSCEPQESRTEETKRPRVGPRTQVPLADRVPVLSSRNRASPTSVLAEEKVMSEKEPILALAEEKEIMGLMSSPAEEDEPYITSTKNSFAILGELMDAEAATEATGSLDKMRVWPEGGIASAGNIVDKMSGCVRARLKWCAGSWTMSMCRVLLPNERADARMHAHASCPRAPLALAGQPTRKCKKRARCRRGRMVLVRGVGR